MGESAEEIEKRMFSLPSGLQGGHISAGVSGGPDSMAMLWLLSRMAAKENFIIHAYTVDHGLRSESSQEACQVAAWVERWPQVRHRILRWQGDKPQTRILEEARSARYALMQAAMKEDGARYLAIAHHRDDQAETFLMRLAKGSGLDGLAGMNYVQAMGDIMLLRPMLDISKNELIAMCDANGIPYVNDPTNKNESYLRPRLRAAREILEEEGLTAKRLSVTAKRLARVRAALEILSQDLFRMSLKDRRENGFLFDFKILSAAPEELVLRVMLQAMDELRTGADYGPRMEKAETLAERIIREDGFKGATLGGCIFAKDVRHETLWIGKEE
jgi:tRNA(Ile)-lysidine synthase